MRRSKQRNVGRGAGCEGEEAEGRGGGYVVMEERAEHGSTGR